MTNQKPPFSTITKKMKHDLIAYLKTQRRYIRSADIIDGFCSTHPQHISSKTMRGKHGILGHALSLLLPKRARNSGSSYLFDNIYSADYTDESAADNAAGVTS